MRFNDQLHPTHTTSGHSSYVNAVCILGDNQTIVTASDDSDIRLWDSDKMAAVAPGDIHHPGYGSSSKVRVYIQKFRVPIAPGARGVNAD